MSLEKQTAVLADLSVEQGEGGGRSRVLAKRDRSHCWVPYFQGAHWAICLTIPS